MRSGAKAFRSGKAQYAQRPLCRRRWTIARLVQWRTFKKPESKDPALCQAPCRDIYTGDTGIESLSHATAGTYLPPQSISILCAIQISHQLRRSTRASVLTVIRSRLPASYGENLPEAYNHVPASSRTCFPIVRYSPGCLSPRCVGSRRACFQKSDQSKPSRSSPPSTQVTLCVRIPPAVPHCLIILFIYGGIWSYGRPKTRERFAVQAAQS